MTTHRFPISVPNPESTPAESILRVEATPPATLTKLGYRVPKRPLRVDRTFFSRAACAEEGEERMLIALGPRESTLVYLTVITQNTRVPGVVAFNVIDERRGATVGGVLVVCADPPLEDGPGRAVPAAVECPVSLAANPYPVPVDDDPAKENTLPVRAGQEVDLVVPLTNLTGVEITEATAYLEHLGTGDSTFTPGMWNIGTLAPADVFYATWRVVGGGTPGLFQGSVVVASTGTEPTRRAVPITISGEGLRPRPPRPVPGPRPRI